MASTDGGLDRPHPLVSGIIEERAAFADTLEAVGPNAPTLCSPWTSGDVAAHVASLDRLAGVPTFVGRFVVGRFGLRLNEPAVRFPALASAAFRGARRRGLPWAVARLRREPPRLLLRPSVRAIGLFEVWVHHEDVLRANGRREETHQDLSPTLPSLLRYHRRLVRDVGLRLVAEDGQAWRAGAGPQVEISGPVPELVLWLAGRTNVARVTISGDAPALNLLQTRLRV
jgi:uncharacterized protein (TIGR03085 family)